MKSQHTLDKFDLEAMAEGSAMRHFRREFAPDRPATRNESKRKRYRPKVARTRV